MHRCAYRKPQTPAFPVENDLPPVTGVQTRTATEPLRLDLLALVRGVQELLRGAAYTFSTTSSQERQARVGTAATAQRGGHHKDAEERADQHEDRFVGSLGAVR
jgi:hypothetical protein